MSSPRSAGRRQRVVASVLARLSDVLDEPARLLSAVVASVAAELDGPCGIWLVDEMYPDLPERFAVAHPDPAVHASLQGHRSTTASRDEELLRLRAELISAPLHVVGRERIDAVLERVGSWRAAGGVLALESLYFVPLVTRGSVLGLLIVGRTARRLTAEDRRLVDDLAGRLALAVDNAMLLAVARGSRASASALVEHSNDMLLLVNRSGRIRYASPSGVAAFGSRSGEELLQEVAEGDRDRMVAAWRLAVTRPGLSEPVDLSVRDAQGQRRSLSAVVNNLLDDPAVAGIVVAIRDVTQERAAEERLVVRAQQQAALAEVSAAALRADLGELLRVAGSRDRASARHDEGRHRPAPAPRRHVAGPGRHRPCVLRQHAAGGLHGRWARRGPRHGSSPRGRGLPGSAGPPARTVRHGDVRRPERRPRADPRSRPGVGRVERPLFGGRCLVIRRGRRPAEHGGAADDGGGASRRRRPAAAAGHHRRPDRPAQPHVAAAAPVGGACPRRRPAGPAPAGPRRLQGRQRLARSRRR